jgi:hypothetical protein
MMADSAQPMCPSCEDETTLIFKFPTKNAALGFQAYMSDGGGEYRWLEPQDMLVEQGDLEPADKVEQFIYPKEGNVIIVR